MLGLLEHSNVIPTNVAKGNLTRTLLVLQCKKMHSYNSPSKDIIQNRDMHTCSFHFKLAPNNVNLLSFFILEAMNNTFHIVIILVVDIVFSGM